MKLADEENEKRSNSWACSGNSILRGDLILGLLKLSKLISQAELGIGLKPINSVLWRLKQDPCEFEVSLGCRVKPCVRTDVFLANRELFPINVYTCVTLPT